MCSDREKEKKEKEEDKHRPGYGRGYFADPDASKGPESANNAEKDGDKTRNETEAQVVSCLTFAFFKTACLRIFAHIISNYVFFSRTRPCHCTPQHAHTAPLPT